jgi:single-strand DNA-binding protein
MLNQLVLVGRIAKQPELRESENGKNYSFITLAVPRSFKNVDGQYDTDFIDCILWDNVASSTVKYCNKGDIVGIKGRLQTRVADEEKNKRYTLEVIAEKVTFLSSNKNKDEDKNQEKSNDTEVEM